MPRSVSTRRRSQPAKGKVAVAAEPKKAAASSSQAKKGGSAAQPKTAAAAAVACAEPPQLHSPTASSSKAKKEGGSEVQEGAAPTESAAHTELRHAVDARHWAAVRELVKHGHSLHSLAGDLRSPFTAAIEAGWEHAQQLIADLTGTADEEAIAAIETLSGLLRTKLRGRSEKEEAGTDKPKDAHPPCFQTAVADPWERFMQDVPAAMPIQEHAVDFPVDVYILMLEHCPTTRARRRLFRAPNFATALWQLSLRQSLPDLARQVAIWTGLALPLPEKGAQVRCLEARRKFLDAPIEDGGVQNTTLLAAAIKRAKDDEAWLRALKVLVRMGATGKPFGSAPSEGHRESESSSLLYVLDEVERGTPGFAELSQLMLQRQGSGVDQWATPTLLFEEHHAECPICLDCLWTSTPMTFVCFKKVAGNRSSEGAAHVTCGHYFCWACASQQYMKQQEQNNGEYHCPVCRAPAQEMMPLPDVVVNPRLWLQFIDTTGKGAVSQGSLISALEAMLPLNTEQLREAMEDKFWHEWAADGNASVIKESDFFKPGGLFEWIRSQQQELELAQRRGEAPNLDPEDAPGLGTWFDFWDRSKLGRLSPADVLLGLLHVAKVSSLDWRRVKRLKDGLEQAWSRYVLRSHAGAGVMSPGGQAVIDAPERTLSRARFCQTGMARCLAKLAKDIAEEARAADPRNRAGADDPFGLLTLKPNGNAQTAEE